jgi:hypothetical protein
VLQAVGTGVVTGTKAVGTGVVTAAETVGSGNFKISTQWPLHALELNNFILPEKL